VPAKAARAVPPRTRDAEPRKSYRRPDAEAVRLAAHRALQRNRAAIDSQAAFHRSLLPILRRGDPLFALGPARMRRLLIGVPGIRVDVRYAERERRSAVSRCPVCGAKVRPIRNATLLGDEVTLGYRCTRCAYWTHLRRRVPIRYQFSPAGIDGSPPSGEDVVELGTRRR
jgi:hypothetical protein